MKGILLAFCLSGGLLAASAPVWAQRADNPNMGHFYMARQQVDILDDAPVVNDRRTQPAPPSQQGGMNGALPPGPMALPKAGWTPYSQSIPSLQNSLPKTVNGVPQKPVVNPHMAKAGKYKAPVKPAAPAGPVTARTYAPYKGYGGGAPVAPSTMSAGNSSSATHVSGSLLHWSRTRPQY